MANATTFKKGEKRPGQGRPKGSLDGNNRLIRTMVAEALEQAGGIDYLVERAHDPRTASAFLSLIGKVMPVQVTGEDGGPVQQVVRIELAALQ
jgi:hypothetical protein